MCIGRFVLSGPCSWQAAHTGRVGEGGGLHTHNQDSEAPRFPERSVKLIAGTCPRRHREEPMLPLLEGYGRCGRGAPVWSLEHEESCTGERHVYLKMSEQLLLPSCWDISLFSEYPNGEGLDFLDWTGRTSDTL